MKIFCIGRNYADHTRELNNVLPTEPVIFMKPDTALLKDNQPFYYPSFTKNLHHELELVVRINRPGKKIDEKFAHKYYDEISVGIDFTARDKQDELKQKSLPWEIAKAFDHSAVLGTFIKVADVKDLNALNIRLEKNGTIVQNGNTSQMIFNVNKIISYISTFFTLRTGDLIYTGTPAGVGSVTLGDHLAGYIEQHKLFAFEIK